MKNITQVAFVLMMMVGIAMLTSCKENNIHGEGKITTQERTVPTFDKVQIDMPVDATIIMGSKSGVEVNSHENLHEHIKTEVNGNTLRIYHESLIGLDGDMNVTIYMPSIKKLDINGAADAVFKGDIQGEEFKLTISGAAEVDIASIHVDKFRVSMSGASEMRIAGGEVVNATYIVTGAGEIDAPNLKSANANAQVSGAGEMSLYVTDKLDADITGAGEIDYTGNPQITQNITGVGSLNNKN